ncbi:Cation efflux system protein CusF precursor [compost metagenome]
MRKIDLAGQRITLRHGPIDSVGMPPMTMIFGVRDAALLEGISVGDKVRFQVEQQGSQFVVTELQAAE